MLRDIFRTIFWNRSERRPRAGWRLVVGVAVVALAWFVASLLTLVFRATPLLGPDAPLVGWMAVSGGFVTGAVLASLALLAWLVDRRRFTDYGLRLDAEWWLDLGFGLVLGAALMTGVFLIELALGWITVTGVLVTAAGRFSPAFWLGIAAIGSVFVGIYEELLLRGYVLTNFAEGFDGLSLGPIECTTRQAVVIATLLSSALFAGLHATNPNATVVSTLALVLAGVFLAAGYLLTDELAMPIGIHITWNFFQGAVYGFPVSGTDFGVSLVAIERHGPRIVTGGQFGPEAGILGVIAMVAGIAAIAGWTRWRYGAVRLHPSVTTPVLRWQNEE